MRDLFGTICGVVAFIAAFVLIQLAFGDWRYRKGYEAGLEEGLKQGQKRADDWWIGVECQVDQARQKIWREEG